jgi:hypothetical protein
MSTKQQRKVLEAVAAMPDDQIDFSDIPEITDFSVGFGSTLKKMCCLACSEAKRYVARRRNSPAR